MSYQSIDKIQNILANTTFSYTADNKKAAGRALGTFIEIITFYMLKAWGFEYITAIERPLSEYANDEISHNVEFTLHGNSQLSKFEYSQEDIPLNTSLVKKKLFDQVGAIDIHFKNVSILDKNNIKKNACSIGTIGDSFVNAYLDDQGNVRCFQLVSTPFAMFECKRVGVEEGQKKGPQTIEKAKQGSYVARTVSSLQRLRSPEGKQLGCYFDSNGRCIVDDYYKLQDKIINTEQNDILRNFILTIGVISNHGNWFTSENMNKELKVLAQSYDWLVFLTDGGLVNFINDLLIEPENKYIAVKNAFEQSYSRDKKLNMFTKSRMDYDSDKALTDYFSNNIRKIENWFNIITPDGRTMNDLRNDLRKLANKDYWKLYGYSDNKD